MPIFKPIYSLVTEQRFTDFMEMCKGLNVLPRDRLAKLIEDDIENERKKKIALQIAKKHETGAEYGVRKDAERKSPWAIIKQWDKESPRPSYAVLIERLGLCQK